jgi:hypothetical protein
MAGHEPGDSSGGCTWCRDCCRNRAPRILSLALRPVRSDFFEKFPLFPFTIVGGFLVQLAAVRYGFGWAVNRRAVEGLGGLAIDGIVICAIGTLSLDALGANAGPLVILAVASVAWSIVLVLVIGRRVFERDGSSIRSPSSAKGKAPSRPDSCWSTWSIRRGRPASLEAIATGNCSPVPSSVVGSSRRCQSLSLPRWVFRSSRSWPWS